MSKFLGPIHFWLHSKITLQEAMEVASEKKFAEAGYDLSALDKWNELYGAPNPMENLEEVINQDNIHGWLQKRIGFAETRFAGKLTQLKGQYGEAVLELAKPVFADFAAETAKQISEAGRWDESLQGAHKILHDQILEGMPCDHAGAVTINEADLFQWKSDRDLHQGYWVAVDGSPADHYVLRDAFNSSFLNALGNLKYQRVFENGVTYYQINR